MEVFECKSETLECWDAIKKIVKDRNLQCYIPEQPPRPYCGGPAYAPTGDGPIIIDYIGVMDPKGIV